MAKYLNIVESIVLALNIVEGSDVPKNRKRAYENDRESLERLTIDHLIDKCLYDR